MGEPTTASRDAILTRLRSGILPTPDEQEVLNMPDGEISRIWREDGFAFIKAAQDKEREDWWAHLIASTHERRFADYVAWFRALPDASEEWALLDVVVEMYPEVCKRVMRGWVVSGASDADVKRADENVQAAWREPTDMWAPPRSAPKLWFSCRDFKPGHMAFGSMTRDGFLTPGAADYLIMHTRHGQSEGIAVSTMSHCKVTVTAVDGPSNYDPVEKTVEFEPGSKSVQAVLAYKHGIPPVIRLIIDIMGLRLLRKARKMASPHAEGYRRDGKPVVPLLASGLDLWIFNPEST